MVDIMQYIVQYTYESTIPVQNLPYQPTDQRAVKAVWLLSGCVERFFSLGNANA